MRIYKFCFFFFINHFEIWKSLPVCEAKDKAVYLSIAKKSIKTKTKMMRCCISYRDTSFRCLVVLTLLLSIPWDFHSCDFRFDESKGRIIHIKIGASRINWKLTWDKKNTQIANKFWESTTTTTTVAGLEGSIFTESNT